MILLLLLIVMLKLKQIFHTISQKNVHDFQCLTLRLQHKNPLDIKPHFFLEHPSAKKYIDTDLNESKLIHKNKLTIQDPRPAIRRRDNASEHSLYNASKIKPIRNQSSSMHVSQGKELQLKRQKLMLELKEVDLELKSKQKEEHLSRIRRNKTQHEDELPKYQKAAKLVEKMNQQRKQQLDKRRKDVLVLKQNVEQSIRRFKDYEEQKQLELLKKKQEIERRIADRKSRAFERQKVNKVSDIIIKELNSYKVSLPDIYTRNKQNQIEVVPLLLTGVEEEQVRTIDSRSDRGKAFLENIRLEDEQRVKQKEKRIEYQKHVRNMHVEYGKKQRLVLKSREKRLSKSRNQL